MTTTTPKGALINVNDFGADPSGITPASDAINAAITSLDTLAGGIVQFGFGTYLLDKPINVDRACWLRGVGGSPDFPGTNLLVNPGVTAVICWAGGAPSGQGAPCAYLEGFSITPNGRDTTTGVCSFTAGSHDLIISSGETNFRDGQLIAIEGVGDVVPLQNITADTTQSSPTVNVTRTGSATLVAGMYVVIGSAYPNPTKVLKVQINSPNSQTWTMARAAATTLSASSVQYCFALIGRIVSGGGTRNVTIDTAGGFFSCESDITHADTGIEINSQVLVERVHVRTLDTAGMAGFCFTVRGSHGYNPPSNCNLWAIENCSGFAGRGCLWVQGVDANVGIAKNVVSITFVPRDFAFVDISQIGNAYYSNYATGGFGYATRQEQYSTTYYSCYCEEGTFCALGSGVMIIGGTMPFDSGGMTLVDGVFNRFQVGGGTPQDTHQVFSEPLGNFFRYAVIGTGASLRFAQSSLRPGFLTYDYDTVFRSRPLAFADVHQEDFKTGTLWLPQDTWLGDDSLFKRLDPTYGARIASVQSEIPSHSPVPRDPEAGPYDHFTTPVGTHLPTWVQGDWIRDPNLLDGCPTRHVIRSGHGAPTWQPNMNYATFNNISPTIQNYSGSYFTNVGSPGTSGGTEPTWSAAPNIGDTVSDGTITWTNAGAAVYTQPVEVDGYIIHTLSGNETWAQTDLQFLCGNIEIQGTLSAEATLTLPVGRYKRWIWNHTTGGFNLIVVGSNGGNAVTIPNGRATEVQCTGSIIVCRTNESTVLGSPPPTRVGTQANQLLTKLEYQIVATTSDATATTVDTGYSPPNNHMAHIDGSVTATDRTHQVSQVEDVSGALKNYGGTVAMIGTTIISGTVSDLALNGATISLSISGSGTLQVTFTPPAGYSGNIEWLCNFEFQEN